MKYDEILGGSVGRGSIALIFRWNKCFQSFIRLLPTCVWCTLILLNIWRRVGVQQDWPWRLLCALTSSWVLEPFIASQETFEFTDRQHNHTGCWRSLLYAGWWESPLFKLIDWMLVLILTTASVNLSMSCFYFNFFYSWDLLYDLSILSSCVYLPWSMRCLPLVGWCQRFVSHALPFIKWN